MPTHDRSTRTLLRGWVPVICVTAIAFVLRCGAAWHWSANLLDDRDDYLTVARQYLAHGFWQPFDGVPSSFRPPLYPLLLAAIEGLGGNAIAWGLLQCLLGAATVFLTYQLGRKLGLAGFSAIAALIVALDPLLIDYVTFPMTETLFTFLLLALINALFVSSSSCIADCDVGPWSPLRAAVIGILFAACALCRPTIWPAALIGGVWILWRWQHIGRAVKKDVRSAILVPIVAVAVVSPWALRNARVVGAPVFTTTHGGYTLFLGNNEDFYEHVAARPFPQEWLDKDPDRFQRAWFARVTKEMEQALGPGAGEVAQDRWMYAKATAAMKSQPRLFLRACVLRAIRFWNVVPLRPARGAVSMVVLVGLCAAFSIELGLFLIGLGGLWWRRDAGWMLLFLFIASFAGVHLFYWSNMRMRAPVVPLLALFGARGVRCLFGCAQLQLQGHSGASGLSPQNSWRQ